MILPERVFGRFSPKRISFGLAIGRATGPGADDGEAVGFAVGGMLISLVSIDWAPAVALLDRELRPRWVCWSNATAAQLLAHGVRLATCWDIVAAHRLLYGGWRADPAATATVRAGCRGR